MSKKIVVSGLSGDTNFNVWVSETCSSAAKTYIGDIDTTTSSPPYVFDIPITFLYASSYCVRVYSSTNCLMCKCFTF